MRVLARAAALQSEGNLRLACHLVEFAVIAEPGSKAAHALRAEHLRRAIEARIIDDGAEHLNHAALAQSPRGGETLLGGRANRQGRQGFGDGPRLRRPRTAWLTAR